MIDLRARGAGHFPLPLVSLPHKSTSLSRKMIQRSKRSLDKAKLIYSMFSSLNTLSSTQTTGNFHDSSLPQRALGHLGDSASAYVRGLTDTSMSVQSFDRSLVDFQSPAAAYATETDSFRIDADAVSLPAPDLRQLYPTTPLHPY